MSKKKIKFTKHIFVLLLTIIIFIFLFSKIDFFEIMKILMNINILLLSIAIFMSIFTNIFLKSLMWRKILKCFDCDMSIKEAFFVRFAGYSFKLLFPMKLGEFVRTLYLKKQRNLSLKEGSASVIFDIMLSIFVLISLALVNILLLKINFVNLFFIIIMGLIFSFIILLCLKTTKNFIFAILKKIHKGFYNGFKSLFYFEKISFRKQSYFLIFAFFIQLIMLINYYILSKAINLSIPFSKMILIFPMIIIISIIPVSIAGLGVREGLIILFFSEFASAQSLLSFGILISFVEYLLPALLGLFFVKPFLSKLL